MAILTGIRVFKDENGLQQQETYTYEKDDALIAKEQRQGGVGGTKSVLAEGWRTSCLYMTDEIQLDTFSLYESHAHPSQMHDLNMCRTCTAMHTIHYMCCQISLPVKPQINNHTAPNACL